MNDNIKINYHFRDIWNRCTTDVPSTSLDNTISTVLHTPKKQGYIRTKNINKPNPRGETPLHTACLKV